MYEKNVKSQENRPKKKIYAKGPRGVKELRSILRGNSLEGQRNLQQKALSSERGRVALDLGLRFKR